MGENLSLQTAEQWIKAMNRIEAMDRINAMDKMIVLNSKPLLAAPHPPSIKDLQSLGQVTPSIYHGMVYLLPRASRHRGRVPSQLHLHRFRDITGQRRTQPVCKSVEPFESACILVSPDLSMAAPTALTAPTAPECVCCNTPKDLTQFCWLPRSHFYCHLLWY